MIDDDVLAFIQASIKSVWALELLLFLRRSGERSWQPDELVLELRSSDAVIGEGLATFVASGLVTIGPDGGYRYRPATAQLERLVGEVEKTYATKPVALVKAIVTAPNDKLRIFSDAFKLKD